MLVKKLIDERVLPALEQEFQEGELLYAAGEAPRSVYYLLEGEVSLLGQPYEELPQPVLPGTLLGLPDLLSEAHQQTALITAPARVLVVEREKLLGLLQQNPALRIFFVRLLSKGVATAQPVYE